MYSIKTKMKENKKIKTIRKYTKTVKKNTEREKPNYVEPLKTG